MPDLAGELRQPGVGPLQLEGRRRSSSRSIARAASTWSASSWSPVSLRGSGSKMQKRPMTTPRDGDQGRRGVEPELVAPAVDERVGREPRVLHGVAHREGRLVEHHRTHRLLRRTHRRRSTPTTAIWCWASSVTMFTAALETPQKCTASSSSARRSAATESGSSAARVRSPPCGPGGQSGDHGSVMGATVQHSPGPGGIPRVRGQAPRRARTGPAAALAVRDTPLHGAGGGGTGLSVVAFVPVRPVTCTTPRSRLCG